MLAALPLFMLAGMARAQPASGVHRIGVLSLDPRAADPRLTDFERALAGLGYVQGRNLVIEWRHSDDRPERLPGLVAELLESKAEVIVATTTGTTEASRRQTTTVPIVFVGAYDPVGSGFAQSLARPGFNLTGVASNLANIAPEQLELLRLAVPRAKRIGVLLNPRNRTAGQWRQRYEAAAAKQGLELRLIQAGSADTVFGAAGAARSLGAQAMVVQGDGIFFQNRVALVGALVAQRMPALFTQAQNVEAGALMSYGPDLADIYRRGAYYVDRLLKGAKPAELPIERSAKLELSVNTKAAAALGLTLPQALLKRADRILSV
jgi:putative ABC transport system substrate-binding protein